MDTREFFQAVISWLGDGYCSVHMLRPEGGLPGRNFSVLQELLDYVAQLDRTSNWYFCLARHGGNRTREQAQYFRSLFADLDLKNYASKAEAIVAIINFCTENNFPRPSAIIDSGGGIHVYWFSNKDLPISEWQPYADGLKIALKNHGVKADLQVTADAARVLRVPGTLNQKYDPPQPVKILPTYSSGTQYDFETDFASLKRVTLAGRLGPVSPAFAHLQTGDLAAKTRTDISLNFEVVKLHCPWLAEVHNTGGEKEPEPLWHDAMRVAVFFGEEEGRELAHAFSNRHVGYIPEKTDEKFYRAFEDKVTKDLGYPKCKTIQDDGCAHCAECPVLKLNKSPLNFGTAETKEDIDRQIKQLGGESPPELNLPTGFCLRDGTVHALIAPSKANPFGALLQLFRNKVSNPTLQFHNGQYGLGLRVQTEMDTWVDVFIGGGDLYGGTVAKQLGAQLVLTDHTKTGAEKIQVFTISWLDRLRAVSKAVKDPGSLGWRREGGKLTGFVYNNKLYKLDGTTLDMPALDDAEFRRHYMPVGDPKYWHAAAKLLTNRKRPELDCLIAIGFAAPLMVFTGNLYGGILSIYGDPGTAKSCAQQVAAAVWGHPKQTRESLGSTPKSVQGRLGRIKNLAAFWDDIQNTENQQHLATTMFVATEGAEGGRLNTDASYKERKDWQTLLVACSNMSFVDYLVQTQKTTTAGMRRVLEFKFDKREDEPGFINSHTANKIFALLEHNYGQVGVKYVEILTKEYSMVSNLVDETIRRFTERVSGTADESYWWAMCGVLIAGAQLAHDKLEVELDYKGLEEFLVEKFNENRALRQKEGTEGGTQPNTENNLHTFLHYYKGKDQLIYTANSFKHKAAKVDVKYLPEDGRIPVGQVIIGERRIIIVKQMFREYLVEKQLSPRLIIDGIVKFYAGKETKFTVGGGTSRTSVQQHCIEIPVPPGSILEDILFAYGDAKIIPRLVPPTSKEDSND